MALVLVWHYILREEIALFANQMRQNKFFNKQIFPALLLDRLLCCLVDVEVAVDNQIFYKIIIMKKRDQLECTLIVYLVVFKVQIEQICVIPQ